MRMVNCSTKKRIFYYQYWLQLLSSMHLIHSEKIPKNDKNAQKITWNERKKNHKKQLQGPSLEHTARGQKANENVIKKSKPYPTTKVVEWKKKHVIIKKNMTKKIENTSKTLKKTAKKIEKIQTEKNTSLQKKVWIWKQKNVVFARRRNDELS